MRSSTEPAPASVDQATPDPAAAAAAAAADVVVQYVVLRRDLIDTWPLGSVVTQGCHASVAAVWAHRDRPDTAAYLSDSNIDSMHKVCSTKCPAQTQLNKLIPI